MKLEIWSDFTCPYCYIGKRNLEAALEQFKYKDTVEVIYRSFELDPYAKKNTNETIVENLSRKYDVSLENAMEMTESVTAQAREVGLNYDFSKIKAVNTFDAHRLSHYAKGQGKMAHMNERLLKAHFTEGLDISHYETLVNLAVEIGLKEEEVKEVLSSTSFSNEVVADEERAKSLDIDGVPYFVFNGQPQLFGAQPVEKILEALYSAWADEISSSMTFEAEDNESSPKGMKCENGVCRLF